MPAHVAIGSDLHHLHIHCNILGIQEQNDITMLASCLDKGNSIRRGNRYCIRVKQDQIYTGRKGIWIEQTRRIERPRMDDG
jgi:hypothetical protein